MTEKDKKSLQAATKPPWTFLTNHAHVLILMAKKRTISLKEVALQVGITERAAQRILAELLQAGYVHKKRHGRNNHYTICMQAYLRHPIEMHHQIGELIELINNDAKKKFSKKSFDC